MDNPALKPNLAFTGAPIRGFVIHEDPRKSLLLRSLVRGDPLRAGPGGFTMRFSPWARG